MGSVKLGYALGAAATLSPPRAASLRRWLDGLDRLMAPGESPAAARERWLREPPPVDQESASRRLIAEDLVAVLDSLPMVSRRIAAWEDPLAALHGALESMCQWLRHQGCDFPTPPLRTLRSPPAPYAHASLWAWSIDAADAGAFGLAPGIWLSEDRLRPLWSELALGHVLIHHLLGRTSPDRIGRGFEEGLAELVGGLEAAAAAVGTDAVDASFSALRLTPSANPHRDALLSATRAAAALYRYHGLGGLLTLIRGGREQVKRAEAALARDSPERLELAGGLADARVSARLERLLETAPRRLCVSALAFYLAPALAEKGSVSAAARELGVPLGAALSACRELHDGAFVAILDTEGRLLADDLGLVLGSGLLRYELPPGSR